MVPCGNSTIVPAQSARVGASIQRVIDILRDRAFPGDWSARLGSIRWARMARILTVLLLVAAVLRLAHFLMTGPGILDAIGIDLRTIIERTRDWLAGGALYPVVSGTYHFAGQAYMLYPPSALPLFIPFTVLPAVMWWLIPVVIGAVAFAVLRPALWTWPIVAFLLFWPRTQEMFLWGNPGVWVTAFVLAGAAWGWPGSLVLIKPSLAPFALFGIRRWGWWIALAVSLAITLPFVTLWLDWVNLVLHSSNGVLYSLIDVPTTSIGVIAWLGRNGRPPLPIWGHEDRPVRVGVD